MGKELQELIDISIRTGSNRSLVLGPYGNTSVKTDDGRYMYIKASGTNLADMSESVGWRKLRLEDIQKAACDPDIAGLSDVERDNLIAEILFNSTCDDFPDEIKPSVESSFHALLGKYVVHLHPAAVLGYACCENGRELIAELFGKPEFSPVWVPHASFGMDLALRMADASCEYATTYGCVPRMFVFQNHGFAVTANDIEDINELIDNAMGLFKSRFENDSEILDLNVPQADIEAAGRALSGAVSKIIGSEVKAEYYIDDNIRRIMGRDDAEVVASADAVTFDELKEAGGGPVWLEGFDDSEYLYSRTTDAVNQSPVMPMGYLVKNVGLFVVPDNSDPDLVPQILSSYLAVRAFAADNGGIKPADPAKYMRYIKSK